MLPETTLNVDYKKKYFVTNNYTIVKSIDSSLSLKSKIKWISSVLFIHLLCYMYPELGKGCESPAKSISEIGPCDWSLFFSYRLKALKLYQQKWLNI